MSKSKKKKLKYLKIAETSVVLFALNCALFDVCAYILLPSLYMNRIPEQLFIGKLDISPLLF